MEALQQQNQQNGPSGSAEHKACPPLLQLCSRNQSPHSGPGRTLLFLHVDLGLAADWVARAEWQLSPGCVCRPRDQAPLVAAHPGAALSRESGVRQCGSSERQQRGWEWEMIIILGVGPSEPLSRFIFFCMQCLCICACHILTECPLLPFPTLF